MVTATTAGTGDITADGLIEQAGEGTLAGAGDITADANLEFHAAAPAAGVGANAADGTLELLGDGTGAGVGAIAADVNPNLTPPLPTISGRDSGGRVKYQGAVGSGAENDPVIPLTKNIIGGQQGVLVDNLDGATTQAFGDRVITLYGGPINVIADATTWASASVKLAVRRPGGPWITLQSGESDLAITANYWNEFGFAKGLEITASVASASSGTDGLFVSIM